MEKRNVISLKGYLTCTLLLAFLGMLLIFAISIFALLPFMRAGILAPANAGEREAAAEIRRQSEAGAFTSGLAPQFYDYIYFDASGNIEASSLQGESLAQKAERYAARNITYSTASYVTYEDGSYCLFIWSYTARFTSPVLHALLPNAELLLIFLTACAMLLFFLFFTHSASRNLGRKITLMQAASNQITGQNLDTPIPTSAGIREFNLALQSMEQMRGALKKSLIRGWESEQQRRQEIAALAHDIKSPLTIICGNAELLLEEPLPHAQENLVQSIHGAGLRAQQYVRALQQISNFDLAQEEPQTILVPDLLQSLQAALSPPAEKKCISLMLIPDMHLKQIRVYPLMLTRALINIAENAIRFTPQGGHITLSVKQQGDTTIFRFADEGPGFSGEALLHATEVFWQQDKSRTGNANYGLGLALAERAAQKHAGHLLLKNTPTGGLVQLMIKNI